MGIPFHTLYAVDGQLPNNADRWFVGTVTATYPAAAQGVNSTVVVTWPEPVPLPYVAIPSLVEDSTYFITARTTLGFTLNIAPRTALTTLAGGTLEILIMS